MYAHTSTIIILFFGIKQCDGKTGFPLQARVSPDLEDIRSNRHGGFHPRTHQPPAIMDMDLDTMRDSGTAYRIDGKWEGR